MYNTSQNYKAKVLNASTQHELKIYIDGNEVEANHIINFKQTIELFNNSEFCLGCTPEIDIEFEIDKRDLPETYNEVYIETGIGDEVVPMGHFTIQKPIEDNEFKVKIKATDYMKKFEDNKYDGSNLTYPQTMLQVLKDICTKIGVELGSTSFLNSNKQIAVYDNTVSARTYLGYIAEQAEGIAVIGRDGKLYIRQLGQDIINFDINLFKDYKWGDKFKVSKVSYEDGIQDYKFGNETADTVYIDQNNMYIVDREQVENIYNQIKDFETYSFEGETIIDPAYDIGDILVIDGKRVLYQGEINYEGKFKANIKSKIQAKTEQESMQTKENNTTKIRRVESKIDQAEGKITQVVQTTTTLEKEITDITTTEATATGKNIHIEDSAEEPLVDIVVKGETKQEGTPTPDEPIEIENVEGKNLFNKDTMAMIYARYISTTNEWKASDDSASVLFPCKPNKIYTISHSCKNVTLFKCGYIKENKENITQDTAISVYNAFLGTTQLSHTIKTGEGATYIIIQISLSYMDEVIETLQIEEGTVATEYVPYNSLEFEVVGKNELYVQDISENTALGTTVSSKNGVITLNGTSTTSFREIKWNSFQTNQSGNYTFSIEASGYADKENDNCALILQVSDNNSNFTALRELNLKSTTLKEYTVTLDTSKYYRLRLYIPKETAFNNVTMKAQLEYGSKATDYEPYKSQTETFPLAEGQKLYEASYLADDGIHHTRKQYVITGEENWVLGTQYAPEYGTRFDCNITKYPTAGINDVVCTHYKFVGTNAGGCWVSHNSKYLQLRIQDNISTVDELKTYLQEQYSNGTPVIVEYELAEEEIIPYTEEQQEAWDKIKELYTYKNITNITSAADLDIVYVRDNGLSDMYETKQNANKRYTETTEKFAETKMTTDSIQDTVSKTETTVANNYDELKTKFNDYAPKSDIITIQNSVEKIQTDTYTKTEINTKLTDGSVTKVLTTAGTFDDNGLTIEKTNAKTKGNFNEKGITVMDATSGSEEELLFAGYDEELSETIVRTKNINVEKYLTKCNIAREEAYTNPVLGGKGIGVFSL